MEWIAGAVLIFFVAVLGVLLTDWAGGRWLVYWHGAGALHQYQFYRCKGCRRIVTHRHIDTGGCRCQESFKISPAKLRLGEKARLLYLPWTVTSWGVRQESARRRRALVERATLERMVQ